MRASCPIVFGKDWGAGKLLAPSPFHISSLAILRAGQQHTTMRKPIRFADCNRTHRVSTIAYYRSFIVKPIQTYFKLKGGFNFIAAD